MDKQIIITVGREYGSGGHEIARKIAERLNLKLYDRNILDEMAEEMHVDSTDFKQFDEKPRHKLFSRTVKGHSNSMEDHLAHLQFEYIEQKAAEGMSFVVVGRCAEHVFKEHDSLISIFVLGDNDVKMRRIMEKRGMEEKEALHAMERHDGTRKAYHNSHTLSKWGDSRTYDLCINSSRLGIDGTVDALMDYIQKRIEKMN